MRLICAAAMLALSGCATLQIDRGSIPTEAIYQALNAADFAQTVTIARNPTKYRETGWPTADIIGSHPSESRALAFGALQGLAHYAVTGWLDREADATGAPAWNAARWIWNIGSLYAPARNVYDNHRMGLHLFGATAASPREDAILHLPIRH